jgi:hypothetical protein
MSFSLRSGTFATFACLTLSCVAACGPAADESSFTASTDVAPTSPRETRAQAASVTISPVAISDTIGQQSQLTAVVADAAGAPLANRTITWSSSDSSVATVDTSGSVTAIAAGTASITASHESLRGSATITVVPRDKMAVSYAVFASSCLNYPHDRVVSISTSAGLTWALQNARPGDLIQLGDARYNGHFKSSIAGSAGHRITVCGSRNAIIDGGSLTSGGFALTIRGNYWVLDGFTVTNTHQGVRFEGSSWSTARGLQIYSVGQEALNIQKFSSNDTLEANRIYDTGRTIAEYGEGLYIGSYNGHWCQVSNCQPDRSDSVVIRNNVIGPNVRAEAIDVKEGTSGGLIEGNTFDGRGMVRSQTWVDSWVELKGNSYRVTGNRGTYSLRDGYQAFQQIPGWGNGNVFTSNTSDLQSSGYGFRISNVTGTTVGCNNVTTNAGGSTNLACR